MVSEIIKLLLMAPFVLFREQIEAGLAILLIAASLTIAIGSWHFFPDHWQWIVFPAIALLAIIFWPLLKLADKVEAHFDQRTPRPPKDGKQ